MKETKTCSKCGIEKLICEFYKTKGKCRPCSIEDSRIYKAAHTAEIKEYYIRNKERIKDQSKIYNNTHKEKRKLYQRDYIKDRRRTDKALKLSMNISTSVYRALRGNKAGRKWESLVGYTLKELVKHIEKQFTGGMTWSNFLEGAIHIDHIIPRSVFNYTNAEHRDFKRCWALSNLQPLWKEDNMQKSNKLEKHFQPSLLI